MTMNDIFGDGEVLGALVTGLLIVGPMLAVLAYDKYKERKRQRILKLCGEAKEIINKITSSR
jgi:hypothetical protein